MIAFLFLPRLFLSGVLVLCFMFRDSCVRRRFFWEPLLCVVVRLSCLGASPGKLNGMVRRMLWTAGAPHGLDCARISHSTHLFSCVCPSFLSLAIQRVLEKPGQIFNDRKTPACNWKYKFSTRRATTKCSTNVLGPKSVRKYVRHRKMV